MNSISLKRGLCLLTFTLLTIVLTTNISAQGLGEGGGGGGGSSSAGAVFDKFNAPTVGLSSPTVASIAKFQEIPVSLYNGTPNISIPLYNYQSRLLSLPITLSYSGGGVRMQDRASWVGLGWALQAGGTVTRTMKGLEDERPSVGYIAQETYIKNNINNLARGFLEDVADGTKDVEPDIFSVSTPTFSGTFAYIDGEFRFTSKQKVKIEFISSSYWKMTDVNGIIYTFNEKETTTVSHTNATSPTTSYTSAWHLTKIESPHGNDEITISYQGSYNSVSSNTSQWITQNMPGDAQCVDETVTVQQNVTTSSTTAKYPQYIRMNDGGFDYEVQFIVATRSDLLTDRRLDKILIRHNGSTEKTIQLTQDYFNASTGDKRLRLTKVQEVSTTDNMGPYEFEYFSSTLPNYNTFAVDHWGYYNAQTSNTTLIPTATIGGTTWFTGANRNVNTGSVNTGMLKKVKHPAGGYTNLEYENHKYSSSNTVAGGARIKKMTIHDGVSTSNDIIKNYTYNVGTGSSSSGYLFQNPEYINDAETTYYGGLGCTHRTINSNAIYPLGDLTGGHIGYTEAKVSYGSTGQFGYEKHYFRVISEQTEGPKNQWQRGQKLGQEAYNSSNQKLTDSENTYYFTPSSDDDYHKGESVSIERKIRTTYFSTGNPGQYPVTDTTYIQKKYQLISGWAYVGSDINHSYPSGTGSPVTTSNTYTYDDAHYQLVSHKSKNSNNEETTIGYEYAQQYYTTMRNNHMYGQLYSATLYNFTTVLRKNWMLWGTSSGNSSWNKKEFWQWKTGGAGGAPTTSNANKIATINNYNSYGTPLQMTDAAGNVTNYYYGSNGSQLSQSGQDTYYGKFVTAVEKVSSGANLITKAQYDTRGRLTHLTDENSKTSQFTYDGLSRLKNTYNQNGTLVSSNSYYYSKVGNGSYVATDPNRVQTTTYAPGGNIISVSYADGLGRSTQAQQRGGSKTIITEEKYNSQGLPLASSRPIERSNQSTFYNNLFEGTGSFTPGFALNGNSEIENYYQTLPSNDEDYAYTHTTYEANPLNRALKSTIPGPAHKMGSNKEILTTYGTNTTETFTTSAHGSTPAKTWAINKLTKVITEDPDGKKSIVYTNGWGQTIASGTDMNSDGKLIRANDLVTEFAYDLRGNMVRSEDPRGLATTYTYDNRNLLVEKKLPDQSYPHKYRYDKKGRLRFHRDPVRDGSGDHYYYTKYDQFDRPTEVGKYNNASYFDSQAQIDNASWPTSGHSVYIYYFYDTAQYSGAQNTNGRLSRTQYWDFSSSSWGNTWYSYNNQGLVEWVVQDLPGLTGDKRIEYEYDALGRMTRLKYNPSGSAEDHYFWYDYDGLGRLQYVYSNTVNSTSGRIKEAEYTYNADGQAKQIKLGTSAQTVDYLYTVQGWLDTINNAATSGSTYGDRFGMNLDYNYNGNISKQQFVQAGASNTSLLSYDYTYDNANRLTSACYGGAGCTSSMSTYDVRYGYDLNGNLEWIDRNANTSGADKYYDHQYVSGTNKLNQVVQNGVNKTFSHDANGNVTVNNIQGITATSYDWRNLPYSVSANGSTMKYAYDADGQRVMKELVSGTKTHYVRGANGETVAIYENGSRSSINLLTANGNMVGTWDGSQRRYFIKDHLGSTRTTVDQSGNVDGYDDYYAFGLVMPGRSSNSANPTDSYKFTGHERDDEASLTIDYMNARTYDPVIGRFLQVDPLSDQFVGFSPYNYALNNPLIFIDPDGRAAQNCCLVVVPPIIGPKINSAIGKVVNFGKEVFSTDGYELNASGVFSGGLQVSAELKKFAGFTVNLGSIEFASFDATLSISSEGLDFNLDVSVLQKDQYSISQGASLSAVVGGEVSHDFTVNRNGGNNYISNQEVEGSVGAVGTSGSINHNLKNGNTKLSRQAGLGFEGAFVFGLKGSASIKAVNNVDLEKVKND